MEQPEWAEGIDPVVAQRPSSARVYDYFLGGAHNFAVDRELADMISRMTPHVGDTMRANRAFLRRVVRYLVDQGVTQFLDIGSGIPTVGNVHEVAQRADPASRVVYVDIDPVAVSHSRAMLAGTPGAAVIQADARDTDTILGHPLTRETLDFTAPIALLVLGVLHFVPDEDDPAGIVARLRHPLVPGSYVALVNVTHEDQPPEVIEAQKLSGRTGTPIYLRSREELTRQFDGLQLVEPGLVHLPLWRPDSPLDPTDDPARYGALAGLAAVP
jgi:O-methyltransferase involved in polyketide biosynthesis